MNHTRLIPSPELAEVMAYAEKPFRDLCAITEAADQQNLLAQADKAGLEAGNKYLLGLCSLLNDRAPTEMRTSTDTDVVLALRELRLSRGISQAEIGQAIGLQQSYISLIERRQHSTQYKTLEDYAAVLGARIVVELIKP